MPNAGSADRIAVVRTYLELRQRPPQQDISWPPAVTLRREPPGSLALARALYAAVGRQYHWYDRDAWPDEQLAAYLREPNVEFWVLRESDQPIGYFELGRDAAGSVEIVYFGLVAGAVGKGLGKRLLQAAVDTAFGDGASRVWLHTCTLDHAAALPNYTARGFVPFRTERYEVDRT